MADTGSLNMHEKYIFLLPLISTATYHFCLDWLWEIKCGFIGICHLHKGQAPPHYWSPWNAINTLPLWNCMIQLLLKHYQSVNKCVYYFKAQICLWGIWRNLNIIGFLCFFLSLSIYLNTQTHIYLSSIIYLSVCLPIFIYQSSIYHIISIYHLSTCQFLIWSIIN